MIILGIDPGLATTGFGVVKKTGDKLECLDYGAIITSPDKKTGQRLNRLFIEISKLLTKHSPDIMSVERLFFFKNLKTAMPVSEAKGVVLLMAAKYKLPVHEFSPPQIKLAITGFGRAEKKEVQTRVQKILKLKDLPRPDHAADALSVAIVCSRSIRG